MFVYMGGNLDALGGLGKMSDTAQQDQLISKSASARIADMQGNRHQGREECCHCTGQVPLVRPRGDPDSLVKIPDTDYEVSAEFSPEIREGEIVEYELDIAPYSMVDRSPSEKAKTLGELMQGFVIPMAPILQQQGYKPDMGKFLELMAKYSNTEELTDIVKEIDQSDMDTIQKMQEASGGGQERPTQSPVTTRTNIRQNIPGSTRGGRDEAMMQLLAGGGQPAQAGQMAETTG